MPDDFYVDPTQPDPQFPDRPTHPDFAVLSDTIQGMDLRVGASVNPALVSGVDPASLMYAIEQRLGTLERATHGAVQSQSPLLQALYLEAFTLGKLYAEAPR